METIEHPTLFPHSKLHMWNRVIAGAARCPRLRVHWESIGKSLAAVAACLVFLVRYPLWVISGQGHRTSDCPFYPRKPTYARSPTMVPSERFWLVCD